MSVTMAALRLTLPLLIPPIILASIKIGKLYDTAHSTYDITTPICKERKIEALHVNTN